MTAEGASSVDATCEAFTVFVGMAVEETVCAEYAVWWVNISVVRRALVEGTVGDTVMLKSAQDIRSEGVTSEDTVTFVEYVLTTVWVQTGSEVVAFVE